MLHSEARTGKENGFYIVFTDQPSLKEVIISAVFTLILLCVKGTISHLQLTFGETYWVLINDG